jgi:hypothetical protein
METTDTPKLNRLIEAADAKASAHIETLGYLAFVTGSRALGSSSPESDLDLVVATDPITSIALTQISDQDAWPCRFGGTSGLNLIFCYDAVEYQMWLTALFTCTCLQAAYGRLLTKDERREVHVLVAEYFDKPNYFNDRPVSQVFSEVE